MGSVQQMDETARYLHYRQVAKGTLSFKITEPTCKTTTKDC